MDHQVHAFLYSKESEDEEMIDHSRNPFCILFFIGKVTWKNETTCKILRISPSYRVGRLEQLDHLKQKKIQK